MIFYTADLHLMHTNVLAYCGRPFGSVEEMNEALIANWNNKVGRNDTVYVIGDLYLGKMADFDATISRLKGHKHLVLGNHDDFASNEARLGYFESVELMSRFRQDKRLYTLCHYPLLEWPDGRHDRYGEGDGVLIHGHIHNAVSHLYRPLFTSPCALNAGVDVNYYAPVTMQELIDNNQVFKRLALDALTVLPEGESTHVSLPYPCQ